jgi:hypothetical protein
MPLFDVCVRACVHQTDFTVTQKATSLDFSRLRAHRRIPLPFLLGIFAFRM